MSNALLNPSLTVTLYGDAVEFLPAAQFNKRNESWREEWWWGEEVSILFRLMTKKGFRHCGVNYIQTTVRRTLQIFSFTLFTSLSDYRIVVRSVSLSNGQLSTSVIIRLVLLMFTGIVIK